MEIITPLGIGRVGTYLATHKHFRIVQWVLDYQDDRVQKKLWIKNPKKLMIMQAQAGPYYC